MQRETVSVHWGMLEEERYALSVVRPPASLGKLCNDGQHENCSDARDAYSWADVDGLDSITKLLLVLVGYRVGNDDLLQFAAVQGFDSVAT